MVYNFENEPAIWRVLATAGFFCDDTLFEEGAEVEYDGEPNLELEPLNEVARQKLIQFIEKLDNLGRQAAEKAGRPWAGYPRHLDGQLALATAVQRSEMNILGAGHSDKTTAKRLESETADTGLDKNSGKRRGRPKGSKNKVQSLASVAA